MKESGRLRCIPTNPELVWVLTKQQKQHVRQVGLHRLTEIDCIVIDHALITALVERWCPKTNSFHFPFGEATITLKDVVYLYGLPIDGHLATRGTSLKRMVQEVYEAVLGITPQKKLDYVGITVKFKWLCNAPKSGRLEFRGATRKYLRDSEKSHNMIKFKSHMSM